MTLEMNEKANVEGRGRIVQRKELVGKAERTGDGRKDGRTWRIRRATFDDLDAIVDINDDVYYGLDYMPALFYTFMHSKLHAIYVQEEDGKLLALINYRFYPESDDLVTAFSARVRPSHEGLGYGSSEKSPLRVHLRRERPWITRIVIDTLYMPNIAEKIKKAKLLYHWNILIYKIADRQLLSRFAHIREMALGAVRPFSLSYTNGTEWLERSDQLVRFISKYAGNLFPVGQIWVPTPTNKVGLRYALSVSKVYVSLDPASTVDSSCPSDILPERGPRSTSNSGQDGDIIGLSFSTSVQCKYGLRIDLFFYGDCEKRLLSHIGSHLLHYVSISSDDFRFGLQLHFPLTIDSKSVEERLKEEIGERLQLGVTIATQAVQYIVDLPPAKL